MNISKIQHTNFFLIFGGYILISFIPDFMGINNRIITVPFRGICLFFSLMLIFVGIKKDLFYKIDINLKFVLLFWAFFIIRIIYDLYLRNLNVNYQYSDKYEYLFWAIGVTFIPMLSSFYIKYLKLETVVNFFYWTLFFSLGFSLFSKNNYQTENELLRQGANQAISVILYGHLGCTLSLLSIYKYKRKKHYIPVLSFIVGVLVIFSSGTRSSFIALVIVSMIYFSFNKNIHNKMIFSGCLIILSVIIIFLQGYIIEVIRTSNLPLIKKIIISLSDQEKLYNGRDYLINSALLEFEKSPIIGWCFVITSGIGEGFYPHNSVVESLMATGIIGGFLFIIIIIKASIISIQLIKKNNENLWIALLFFQYLLYSLSSMALYKHQTLWIMIVFLFIINSSNILKNHERNKNISNNGCS